MWVDQTGSAEVLTAQMGAMKAGVTVISVSDKENIEAVHETLKNSGAKGLLFSPETQSQEDGETRLDQFNKLMPELESCYLGDKVEIAAYPGLSHISHIGHNTIRGTNKFKDTMFYANVELTSHSIPENTSDATVFEVYKNGKAA
jgi:hypothetical protein